MALTDYKKNPFLSIPYQSFEIENVFILPPKYDNKDRIYSQLCYKDSSVEIQDIPILTPPLKVQYYDIRKSFLYLEIDESHPFAQKMNKFQEVLIQTFYNYQNIILPHLINNNGSFQMEHTSQLKVSLSNQSTNTQTKKLSLQKIRSLFQLPFKNNCMILYIHPNTTIQTSNDHELAAYQLIPGTYIRTLLRLYNIITIKSTAQKNYLRIQQSVPFIWYVGVPRILKRPTNYHEVSEKCLIIA